LERVVNSQRWLHEHIKQTSEYYGHPSHQLNAISRHINDPRRHGGTALRGNDVARLLSLLDSVDQGLLAKTDRLLRNSIQILKEEDRETIARRAEAKRQDILKKRSSGPECNK